MVSFKSEDFSFGTGCACFIFLAYFNLEEAMKLTVCGRKRYVMEMEVFLSTNGIPFSVERPEFWKYSRSSDKVWVTFQLRSFRGICYLTKKYEKRCFLQYRREVGEAFRQDLPQQMADQEELQPYEDLGSYEARMGGR